MKSRFSISELTALGVSQSTFQRLSGICPRTIHRMDKGDPKVRARTWAKAEQTLAHLKRELQDIRRNSARIEAKRIAMG